MPSEKPISDAVDPLRGISGLMLFPRTIRAAADVPAPLDARDLESIHNFVKSLELRSPEKLMNEAKRIVDGGAESLDYNLAKFTENVSIPVAVASKGEDRPREQRQGLGLARKRRPFSLKSNTSQPSVYLESTLDISNLEDPDEFFDAYERMEKANKEIQKQTGNMDGIENYRPSNNARRQPRPGILGKTYHFKHQYPSEPSENDRLMLSSETVDQDITGTPGDESHEKLVHVDPIPSADVEEVETTVSTKKTDNEVSGLLEELLSCNIEDLEGDGALNLLQERLKIKPLDLESLCTIELPGVRTSTFTVTERDLGSTSVSTAMEHLQKHKKSSPDIGSVLKNLSGKFMDYKLVVSTNSPCSSPTPPRRPFALISSLQKRISQPDPLEDQFSPTNADLSPHQKSSPARSKHKLLDQVASPKCLGLSNELELCAEVDDREPVVSNMDAEREMGVADGVPNQFVDENARATSEEICRPSTFPVIERDLGSTSVPTTMEHLQKHKKNSPDIGTVLKKLSGKFMERKPVVSTNNPCSSPTPRRSPFALISSLQKRISQPDPLKDQFSPTNADLSPHQKSSPARSKHKLLDQIASPKSLGLSNELELCVEVDDREPVVSNMDAEREMGVVDGVPNQFAAENARATSEDICRPSTFTVTERDLGSTSVPTAMEHLQKRKKNSPDIGTVMKKLSGKFMERKLVVSTNNSCSSPTPPRSPSVLISSLQKRTSQPDPLKGQLCVEVEDREPVVSNMDAERELGVAYGDPNQFVDENASATSKDICRPNKEPDNADKMSVDEVAEKSYPSELGIETCDDTLGGNQTDTEQHPEVPASKLRKGRKAAGVKRSRKADTMRGSADKSNPSVHEDESHDDTMRGSADKSNPSVHEDESHDDTSNQKHTDTEQQLERRRKVAGENLIRKAHPTRKSLAECGTSLENGVRRSKRMKMRPLEYWKGERFLYGRVGESFKLIGVKYISPGKSSKELKVKPYNIPDTSEFKELLELAARH